MYCLFAKIKKTWFLLILMSSQPCEEFFRKIRSFTSTYSTQVNFSMLEIIQRIKKIQLQGEIIQNNKENIKFPRLDPNLKEASVCELPENENIFNEIEKARKDAITTLNSINITVQVKKNTNDSALTSKSAKCAKRKVGTKKTSTKSPNDAIKIEEEELNACGVSVNNDDDLVDEEKDEEEEPESEDASEDALYDDFLEDVNTISSLTGELMLKDYSAGLDNLHISKKIPLTVVEDSTGKKKIVRKSTLLWVLVSNPNRLSSDRLERVKITDISCRAACVKRSNPPTVSTQYQFFRRQDEITIGEWCLFHIEEDLVIAFIVGFKYLSGKTIRDTKYSRQCVEVNCPKETTSRGIGVLGTWHKLKGDSSNPCKFYEYRDENASGSELSSSHSTFHEFLNIRNYIGTVEKPVFVNGELTLKSFQMSTVLEITSYLKKGYF